MIKVFFDKFNSKQQTKRVQVHEKWRKFSYERKPEEIGVSSKEKKRVFGVLIDSMEFDNVTQSREVVSLIVFLNGELVFLSSTRRAFLDISLLKGWEDSIKAIRQLIDISQSSLDLAIRNEEYSLPDIDHVSFHIITTSGTYIINLHCKEIPGSDDRIQEIFRWFGYFRW